MTLKTVPSNLTFNFQDVITVLDFYGTHHITVEPSGADMWRIKTANTMSGNRIENLDISRTYPSREIAHLSVFKAAGVKVPVDTSAAA